jgi:hypothetical protein
LILLEPRQAIYVYADACREKEGGKERDRAVSSAPLSVLLLEEAEAEGVESVALCARLTFSKVSSPPSVYSKDAGALTF